MSEVEVFEIFNFRLQQTLVTREKQLETWASLVIDYAQHNKIYTLEVAEIANSELFHNQKLNSESFHAYFFVMYSDSALCRIRCYLIITGNIERCIRSNVLDVIVN